ncbi:hypothetical protein KY290_014718 [Solanum tuberosum]|uniref:SWIM-type domain-containing protein n=1 Tax=Solanum tuberosum TaxID=4113 RepID=A0ABQ7VQF4_SOLTU|nr:hypothetical protein KY290_014718 [Solanum tuberosum]
MARYPLCVTTTEPVNLETNSTLIPLLCSDTSEDMRVIHNSYFSNTFNGIGEAIGLIGFGSCEEVDELEELAPGIIVNPNHSLFEKDKVYKNKYVITSALKRHSILKHFQFKTTRSSSIRWEYCRPIVVVDGTFLKGAYKGTLLTANTLDAAGSILPLAYAIVDSENDASWRHASIIKATSRVYDEVPHFAFEKIDKRIKDYLLNIGYNKWSRVHVEVNRTWMMTSNIAESVNSRTRHAKVLTVLHLLEFMRQLVQKWNNNNRSKATFLGFHLGKKYENILQRNKTASEKLRVVETNKYVYTVLDGITQFTVCLHQRTCTCGRFQLDELPCPHALAILTIKHTGYEKYCSDYYTRKNLLLTYQFQMDPLPDESTWNTPTHVLEEAVLPPHGKRPPGRPKNKRHTQLREDGFKKAKITCSNCGQQDHNRKTCKNVRPYDQE